MTAKPKRKRSKTPVSNLYIVQYAEVSGVGMGRLSNGALYLTQRGLARLCGVQNAHIGTISRDWAEDKPRIRAIKTRLSEMNEERAAAHVILTYQGRRQYCYDVSVCRAILSYYANDAGRHVQIEAASHIYDGTGLSDYIAHTLDGFTVPAEPAPLRFQPVVTEKSAEASQALSDSGESNPMLDAHDALTRIVLAYYQLSFAMAQAYVNWLRSLMQAAAWNRLGLYVPLNAFLTPG